MITWYLKKAHSKTKYSKFTHGLDIFVYLHLVMSDVTLQLLCSNLNTLIFYKSNRVRKQFFHTFTAYSNNWKHFLHEVSFIKHTIEDEDEEINKSFESRIFFSEEVITLKMIKPFTSCLKLTLSGRSGLFCESEKKNLRQRAEDHRKSLTIWACCSKCRDLAAQPLPLISDLSKHSPCK